MSLKYLIVGLLSISSVLGGDISYENLHLLKDFNAESFILIGEKKNQIIKEDIKPFLEGNSIELKQPTSFEELKKNLENQLERRSGDDVGNGGDHLRQVFFQELKEVAEHFNFQTPKIQQLIVVENLGRPLLRTEYKSESLLLLDKEIISEAIAANRDLRAMMVQVLFPGHKDYLSLYQNLPPKSGRPLCFFNFTQDLEVRIAKDFKGHHEESPEKAREIAMGLCKSEKLKGCFVFSQEHSGFLGNLLHRVVVRGYEVKTRVLDQKERKNLACKAALQCEELTFSAPFGQVLPEDFSDISALIEENCP